MKVIIAGGRDFKDYDALCEVCDQLLKEFDEVEIVSGNYYRGADYLGECYAKERGYPVKKFPANWNVHGRAAGPKRNAQMAAYADMLITFWDGRSRGTLNMILEARKRDLKVFVLNYSK